MKSSVPKPEQICFQSASVARGFPEGSKVLIKRTYGDGSTTYEADNWHRPDWVDDKCRSAAVVLWALLESPFKHPTVTTSPANEHPQGHNHSTVCPDCLSPFDSPGLHGCVHVGHRKPDLAERIVQAIEADLRDRRGLKHEFEMIHENTQQEIRLCWAELVRQTIHRYGDPPASIGSIELAQPPADLPSPDASANHHNTAKPSERDAMRGIDSNMRIMSKVVRESARELINATQLLVLAEALTEGNRIESFEPFTQWLETSANGNLHLKQMAEAILFALMQRHAKRELQELHTTAMGHFLRLYES